MSSWTPHGITDLLARLSERDLCILEDVERYRLLTTGQIQRLHFTLGHRSELAGTRAAVRVLARLEGHGLLARTSRRMGGAARGSGAIVWQLAATGERLLRARRAEPARRRFQEPSQTFALHVLETSELAVRVVEAARDGDFDIITIETEPASWRSFTTAAGGVAWVKPDLALVTADAVEETHLWIEVDRATEHLPAVLRKCALYQRYYASGQEQAKRGVFPLVVWSVPDEKRAALVARAIRGDPALDERLFTVRPALDVLSLLKPPGDDDLPVTERRNP